MTEVLRQHLEATGRFEVRVNEEPAGIGPETLNGYDLVVLNYTNYMGKFGPTFPERSRAALLDHLKRGKGIVAYHAALSSFAEWPEYERMIGGAWRSGSKHAPYHTFRIELAAGEHPIVAGLPASFMQSDELNQGLHMQNDITMLATAFDDPKNCTEREPKTCGSGKQQPVMWTSAYNGGRVFTTALGHDMVSIKSAPFIATFVRGAEWAATGKVTIAPPAALAAPK
jgi:type 1 glutamine amidotransferase